jgi:hypothetical protein
MKIKVILEREIDIRSHDKEELLEWLGVDSFDEIDDMEVLQELEDQAGVITTGIVSVNLIKEE